MSELLADDRPRVSRGWMGTYGLLYLGVNIAWAAPSQLLVANQILAWHPEDKEALLATVMTVGGLLALVASPVIGWLSDRTRSPLGRRAPWIIGGAIGAAAALVGLAFAPSYGWLVALWGAFQVLIACAVNASQAIPPDRVSRTQYGMVSAIMGIAWTLAVVVGTLVGESLSIKGAYFASAALLVALIVPFLVRHNQAGILPTPDDQQAALGADHAVAEAELTGGFTERTEVGLAAYKDFIWVFLSRLTATLGNTVALFYLLYYLRDHIGLEDPDGGVLTLTAVYAVVTVGISVAAGKLSDRLGVRRPFVFLSCLVVALACVMMAYASSFTVAVAAAVVLGAGWGTFTAIDQALINQVLPHAATRGRDVSIMTIAVSAANLLAPVLAAFTLLQLGGYPGLYLISAGLAVVGAASVMGVRGTR